MVSNNTMSVVSKYNKCAICQQKITNTLTIERHVVVGSYFCTHIFCSLDFDTNDVVSFNVKRSLNTVNICSPNLTKPKKKSRNTTKCHNIFTIPLFSVMVSFGLIYYYLFYRNAISIILS